MSAFTKYDYDKGEYVPVPGTEDLQHVASADKGEMYEWDTIGVYYSPSARRYFWLAAGGCSCSSFGDNITAIADFQSGTRDDALRAAKDWAVVGTGYGYTDAETRAKLLESVRTFEEAAQ